MRARRSKGKEKEILGRKREGRARNEEGERVFSPRFSLSRTLAFKFPSLPFPTFATYARDNKVILSAYSSS